METDPRAGQELLVLKQSMVGAYCAFVRIIYPSQSFSYSNCLMPTLNECIIGLYTSPGHAFFGRHGKTPMNHAMESRESVHCVAGRGLEGDRFFDHDDDYKGQVTFFQKEVYEDLCREIGVFDKPITALRRNVITSDVDLNELVGKRFQIQGVEFEGVEECRPCYWMDRALGEGAEMALQGKGGLRARILTSGYLRSPD